MARKSHRFAHLLQHFRANRVDLLTRLRQYQEDPTELSLARLAAVLGALECLYWQALGCDEVLLAKKIARTTEASAAYTTDAIGCITCIVSAKH
ncbi:hypothetical protein [Shewanella baltica]|uniref:hypothetical protein n=1 Tax=Shewanella baltica TaxID=62322 RepID=UPI0001DB83C2|nr:hypothetical protein [Shewanella baltica]ADT95079.1 hypothetical protein Sbal678_2930 [Shewanella baltica OS678]